MISRINYDSDVDVSKLGTSCYGRKILSYYYAYGLKYDFCTFYRMAFNDNYGYILLINSTMIICADGEFDIDELRTFVYMHMPFRIELSQQLLSFADGLSEYQKLRRTMFEFSQERKAEINESDVNSEPKLDEVYAILKEGFPNLLDYGFWLTDTSHRIRRGISKAYTYKDCTTASIVYDISGTVLVGQVATMVSARGSGYAREFLYWLGSKLYEEGKNAMLFALDIRRSFYHEIGFKEIMTEFVLERQDIKKDSQQKGALI